jgi:hypothetical protein
MYQGSELWFSHQLLDVAEAAGYTMEPTGSNAASQNGKVEQPNSTFGAMERCLIYSAGLSSIFWYVALVHAVYIRPRTKLGPDKIHHWTIFILLVPS